MGCSFNWTILYLSLLVWGAVQSQNCAAQRYQVDNLDPNSGSSRSQLMNTLLTVAAANGVLPELLPVIQPSLPESKDTPKTLNLIQLSPNQRSEEPPVRKPVAPSNQPIVTPLRATPYPFYNIPLQTTFTPRLTPSPVVPASQTVESPYQVPPSAGIQAIPATWKANRSDWLQEPPMPANLQITPPAFIANERKEEMPAQFPIDYDSPPMNLQINLPSQNPPQITVVSASPRAPEALPSPYPYHPPIIIDRGDSLNSILPIMLVALIANDRDNCGCNCCCPCSKNVVPIPYPIPFPVNSPVVTNSRSNKSSNDDDKER
ncbi:vegetative cell wall protein gp1-like [Pieris rapae]|uniref:vegetative cell wall protein gp1-like n=1 Tax=Pieris rapae TaxID=64459 RepID=UPI001E27CE8D|nr:vegetative cell wall protein gp1-like [Pieris rapae]